MYQTFLTRKTLKGKPGTQKALQGHSNVTQIAHGYLSTPRALRHLGTPWALELPRHVGTWELEAIQGHLGTRNLKTLRHLRTQELEHLGTGRPLGHSGTQALGHSRYSRHFI